MQKEFHIQNIFDALNSSGKGVIGPLKDKCMHLQNRVIAMAKTGDIVAVSTDCPEEFFNYICKIKRVSNVTLLKFASEESTEDMSQQSISSYTIFELIEAFDPKLASKVKKSKPKLQPYMHSNSFYEAAEKHNWIHSSLAVPTDIIGQMNDKTVLFQECTNKGIPFPKTKVVNKRNFLESIVGFLNEDNKNFLSNKLFIRQARSGGGLGNITVEQINNKYFVHETRELLSLNDFIDRMNLFADDSHSFQFVVSELLELYASPGSLFYVDDFKTHIVAHTGQILTNKREFTGFMYPIRNSKINKFIPIIEEYIEELTKEWRKKGFRGFGNIDWMISRYNEKLYIAERNARQTAVVSPLNLLYSITQGNNIDTPDLPNLPLNISVITQDSLHLHTPSPNAPSNSFESIKRKLKDSGLLFDETKGEGIIITIPPTLTYGPNQVGIMIVGKNPIRAINLLRNCSIVLEAEFLSPATPVYWDDWSIL
ncbi:hypothetical protein [Candidatus Leptofilum sp.]|uniref:hypothetical protein n=1 Tax=Candidatus Leptofilum sp. TaxID=3241576 RepID=UPI003B5BEF27